MFLPRLLQAGCGMVWCGMVRVCVCVCVCFGNTVLTLDELEWAYLFSEDLNPTPTP